MPVNPNDPNNPNLPPGNPKVRFEDIMDIQDAEQKLTSIFRNSIKNLEDESKETFKKLSFGIDKVVEKEVKRAEEVHRKFLKATLSAEKFHMEELKKERDELIQQIQDEAITERNVIIGGLKDKKEREDAYARHKIQTATKVAKVEEAFNSKIRQEGIKMVAKQFAFGDVAAGYLIKYATKANVVVAVLTGIVSLLNKALGLSREFAEVQVSLRGAGFGGSFGVGQFGAITGDVGRLFNNLQEATRHLSVSNEDVREFIINLAEAPKTLREIDSRGAGELVGFAGAMADIGVSFKDTIQIVAGASNDLNMNTKKLIETYKTARGITAATGMNTKLAFNTLLTLTGALRGLTFNAMEASKVLVATALPLQRMGFSNVEIQKFASNLAGVLGQLSPSRLAGMMGFVRGKMPTVDELEKEGGLGTLADYMNKVLSEFNKNTPEYFFALEALAKEAGLPTSRQNILALKGTLESLNAAGGIDQKERESILEKFEKDFRPTEEKMLEIQKSGFQAMIDLKSPMEIISANVGKFLESWLNDFIPFMRSVNQFINMTMRKVSTVQGMRQDIAEGAAFAASNPGATAAMTADLMLAQHGFRLPKNLRPNVRHARGFGYFVPKTIDPRAYD